MGRGKKLEERCKSAVARERHKKKTKINRKKG